MRGSLKEGVLTGLLRDLYVGRKTGRLRFEQADVQRSLLFWRGQIVHASSSRDDEHLGECLVAHGLLQNEDLHRATEKVVAEKKRLGSVLEELGLLDKDGIENAIALHARDVFGKVLDGGEGEYGFEELDPETPLEADVSSQVATGDLILEAVHRLPDAALHQALGDLGRTLVLSNDPLLRFQRITLTPADGYVLSRVDGTLAARELIQLIPMVEEETERSLYGLLCAGIVDFEPAEAAAGSSPMPNEPRPAAEPTIRPSTPAAEASAPPPPKPEPAVASPPKPEPAPPAPAAPKPAPAAEAAAKEAPGKGLAARRQAILEAFDNLKDQTHFEVLGITTTASEGEVKEAYFRLAKEFHPDRFSDPRFADLRVKVEAVFVRLGAAYDVLKGRESRGRYEADLKARAPRGLRTSPSPAGADGTAAESSPQAPDPAAETARAEALARTALRLFAAEKYWDAIQAAEAALPALTGKWRRKAQITLAQCYLKNPNWVKQAEERLQAILQEDPQNLEAHFLLGKLYHEKGMPARATAMLRKLLELRPDHEEAAALLAAVAPSAPEPAQSAESGGLLKKLFRKG